MSFALLVLAVVVIASVGVGGGNSLWNNFQPGKNKIQQDLQKMRSEIQPYVSELVPMEGNDLELLSLNQIDFKNKKRLVRSAKGVFTSIYHEPMIAWSYRRYLSSGSNALLYARTAKHEFMYRIRKKGVEVAVDGQFLGKILEDGRLVDARGRKLLAAVNRQKVAGLLPVYIGDKEVANIKLDLESSPNPRALEFVKKMNKEEKEAFLSLTILEMVQQKIQ